MRASTVWTVIYACISCSNQGLEAIPAILHPLHFLRMVGNSADPFRARLRIDVPVLMWKSIVVIFVRSM